MGVDVSSSRVLTGARPTGALHLGHFAAIVQPMLEAVRRGHQVIFVIADIHALTTHAGRTESTRIGDAGLVLAAQVLASGVDPEMVRLVRQSDVPELSQTYALVQSLVPHAALVDMASYEAMSAGADSPSLGLLGYPVMEAADAIALQAEVVLVGEHNVAHVETAQSIAHQIRDITGVDLVVPTPLLGGVNLVGLDGTRKMSKSLQNDIGLLLDEDTVFHRLRGSALMAEGAAGRDRLLALLGIDDAEGTDRSVRAIARWVAAYRARTEALLKDPAMLGERITRDSAVARVDAARICAGLLEALRMRVAA